MLMHTTQSRVRSKRWIVAASVLVILLASITWGFDRLMLRPGFERTPAFPTKTADSRKQAAEIPASTSSVESKLIDSDNDGIPDLAELRTYEDRENFRRWFTAVV